MIEWSDSLSVGVTVIDDDHKILIGLLNRYIEAVELKSSLSIHTIFRELEQYTYFHFAREEDLMEQCGYEQLEPHKEIHRDICDLLHDYYEDVLFGIDDEQEAEIKTFLNAWLTKHILGEDFQYRDAMGKLNLG